MSFDRRLTPARPDLADERLRGQVEASRYTTGTPMRVIAPSAPLRRSPAPDAPLDTEALMGEAVTVYDADEAWAWGQLAADLYVGYLPRAALGASGPAPTHRVRVPRTFLYPGPNLKLPVSGFLSLGAKVTVAGIETGYARLGTGLYVFADHLDRLDAHEPDFVTVAECFLWTPYLWGGRTSLGLDCSGLVQLSLQAAGIEAPRDTDMQERALGAPLAVDPELRDLARGDLIFWKGHVGIMLDRERLLHANGHHMMVAIEPLRVARERILAKSFGPITSIRRLALPAGP